MTLHIILDWKLLEGSNFCLIHLLLCPQHLEQYLTYVFSKQRIHTAVPLWFSADAVPADWCLIQVITAWIRHCEGLENEESLAVQCDCLL